MNRCMVVILAFVLLLCSCRVQRTPEELIDRRHRILEDSLAAEAEIRGRLVPLVEAMRTGDAGAASALLEPDAHSMIVGVHQQDVGTGQQQLHDALANLLDPLPADVEIHGLRISVGPRASTAWFAAQLDLQQRRPGGGADTIPLRLTGVHVLRQGEWRLAQIHLSAPSPAPTADRFRPEAAQPEVEP